MIADTKKKIDGLKEKVGLQEGKESALQRR
jgi:hypothetical protein